ncbi:hypothetical protein [Amycolatopsis sp.]|uniref:hypothetical protein n=1 Tax=Amycolatopsis sp. TaxID=37632 RepID=UPI002D04C1EE|nr:hypothetical protein [Amycolatopsis sp.]HVV14257.1 hypothetical protein [Amycolatopsis sp.]
MTARTTIRSRTRLTALLCAVALLAGACGNATAGTPVPNGDEVSSYLSAKFSDTLQKLSDSLGNNDTRKSVQDTFARFDQKKINSTITAVQLGHPPARLSKNHSNQDSNEYLDDFHPANSPVEYLLLGPVYASLAPTHWVSMPYTAGDYNECYWGGSHDVCKMLGAIDDSVTKSKGAQSANSKADGSIELTANVTMTAFLDNSVITFPQSILDQIGPEMKTKSFQAKITLDGQGKLTDLQLGGTVTGDGHELEINEHYRLDGVPTENDLPKVPDAADVTVLADSAAVDDFYNRMGEIQDR